MKRHSVWVKAGSNWYRFEDDLNEFSADVYAKYYEERGFVVEVRVEEQDKEGA